MGIFRKYRNNKIGRFYLHMTHINLMIAWLTKLNPTSYLFIAAQILTTITVTNNVVHAYV